VLRERWLRTKVSFNWRVDGNWGGIADYLARPRCGDGLFLLGKLPRGFMTRYLYYEDAYLRTFDATVTAIDRTGPLRVALDSTTFYPGGGGQPHDEGWLTITGNRYRVSAMKKEGEQIWHTLQGESGDAPLAVGDQISGELDWDRRYQLMRTHTAMHILCGVVWRDYGASVTGGNMDPGQSRMDFEFASLTRDLISEIEANCNAEIAAARAIQAQILPREEAFATRSTSCRRGSAKCAPLKL
jgi:misacylated tRNA(Ala) deacylase